MLLLQSLRQRLAGTRVEHLLRRARLGPLVLGWYERSVFARGRQTVGAFGLRMTFLTRSRSELTRIDMLAQSEMGFSQRMLASLRPGDLFFDVGANIGTTAVMMALRLRQLGGGRVVACEPNPLALETLRSNCALNAVSVDCLALALGAEEGRALLQLTGDPANGTDSLCRATPTSATLEVAVRRGDAVARELGLAPDVVKIDVEGFELEVLRGFFGDPAGPAPREFFVEVHPPLLAPLGHSEAMVLAFMATAGYLSVWHAPRGTEVHYQFRRVDR